MNSAPFVLYNDSAMRELVRPLPKFGGRNSEREVYSLSQIYLPTPESSELLLGYDQQWNSWVHCATEYPEFHHEFTAWSSTLEADIANQDVDLFWLAVYLSTICVSDAINLVVVSTDLA